MTRAYLSHSVIIMNFEYINLSDIAYEQIEGNFWYGCYGVFRVVMMKDCGFINATKLCADGGKDLSYWFANQISKELMRCLSMKLGECGDIESILVRKVVKTFNQTDIEKAVSGTYFNPLIIPHIACWISPDFAIRVSEIVNHFLLGEYRDRLKEEQVLRRCADMNCQKAEQWAKEEKAGREVVSQLLELTEQQNKVMIQELELADEEVKQKDEEVKQKDRALDDKNVELARKGAELAHAGINLHQTKWELGGAKCKIVKNRNNMLLWSSTHSFAIMKVNDATARGAYYAIRRKRRDMRTTIRKFTNKHPQATIMYHQKFTPNSVNLFQRLKAIRIIASHQNYFNIVTCEHNLVNQIQEMIVDPIRPADVNFSELCS